MSNLETLVPVANQFAASTPDILQILAEPDHDGLDHQQPGLGSSASHRGRRRPGRRDGAAPHCYRATVRRPDCRLRPVPDGDLPEPPAKIAQLLQGLDAWANAWIAAEASGPYLNLTQTEVVANPADLGLAVLGGPEAAAYLSGGLGPGYVNPPTYSSPGTLPSGSATMLASTVAPQIPGSAETQAVSQIVTAVSGAAPSSPAVSTLLLSPVLENLVTRS